MQVISVSEIHAKTADSTAVMLECTDKDLNFLNTVISDDEMDMRTIKPQQVCSNVRVMLIVFVNYRGVANTHRGAKYQSGALLRNPSLP